MTNRSPMLSGMFIIWHQEYMVAGTQEGLLYYASSTRRVPPRIFFSDSEAAEWWGRHAPSYPPIGGDGVTLVPLPPRPPG